MTPSPDPTSERWPRRRVAVLAAEVLLVLALVALNVYLWARPGRDDSTNVADSGASASTTPSSTSAPPTATASTAAGTPSTTAPSATTATSAPSSTAPSSAPASTGSAGAPVDVAAALKSAGRLIVVIDTSPAMASHLPAVKAGLSDLLHQAPDGVTVGLIGYSADGPQVLADPTPLDGTHRDDLLKVANGLTASSSAAATRPLFDALLLGYQHALAGPAGSEPAPILMTITDGGRSGGSDFQTFVTFAKAEQAQRARSAAPVFIGISPGADVPLLDQVAAAVGGRTITAASDDQLHSAMLDLPAPRSTPTTPGSPTS